jgi:hypothetical protein
MKQCILTKDLKPFSFACDAKELIKAISKVSLVAESTKSSEDKNEYVIASSNKNLFVLGYSTDTFSIFHLPNVKTDCDGSFAFEPKTLTGLIKNRSDLSFSYKEGRFHFSALKGKYSADIITSEPSGTLLALTNSKTKSEKVGKSTTISGDMLVSLREAIKTCNLENLFDVGNNLNCLIRASGGVLEVSCADSVHMAYYKARIDKSAKFRMSFSAKLFSIIDKFVTSEGEDVDFVFNDNKFIVSGKSYMIDLPPVQTEDGSYDLAPNYIKLLKDPIAEFVFREEGIKTIGNMFSIADGNSRLQINIGSKSIGVSLSTESGSISDEFKTDIKASSKFSVLMDPRIFSDLFSKINNNEIPIKMFKRVKKDSSSAFMITESNKHSKTYLVGMYYED